MEIVSFVHSRIIIQHGQSKMEESTTAPTQTEEQKTTEPVVTQEPAKKPVVRRRARNSVAQSVKSVNILSALYRGEKQFAHAACKKIGTRYVSTVEGNELSPLAGNLQSRRIEGEIVLIENKNGGVNIAFNGFKANYGQIPDSAFICIRDMMDAFVTGKVDNVPEPIDVSSQPQVTPVKTSGKRTRAILPDAPMKRQFTGKHGAIAARLASEKAASLEEEEEESVNPPGESDSDDSSLAESSSSDSE